LPVVRSVVRRRLDSATPEEREDVCAEALSLLLTRLRAIRLRPDQEAAIIDFAAYAAGVAINAIHSHTAAKFPARARLRRRLRFVLTTYPAFCLWQSSFGSWLCAAEDYKDAESAPPHQIESCRAHLATQILPVRLEALLGAIFRQLRCPIDLNHLTTLAATVLGIDDQPANPDDLESLPDPRARQG